MAFCHETYVDNDPCACAFGNNFTFRRNALVSVGFVEPVTGPKPFNWEFLLQVNWRF